MAAEALLSEFLDGLTALVDVLRFFEDTGPGPKCRERDTRTLTVGDEILALTGKEQVGLPRGTQIADPIAGIQQGRSIIVVRHLGDGVRVGADGEALVMAEAGVLV